MREVFVLAFVEFVPPVIAPVKQSLFLPESWLPWIFVYLGGMAGTKLTPTVYLDLVFSDPSAEEVVAVPLKPPQLIRHYPSSCLPI